MSTVTCSKCKANNPVGSKFCNSCGAQLPPNTNLYCPNCQTPNPPHLLYCDNCGTRLLPETGLPVEDEYSAEVVDQPPSQSRAFSLPAREPGDTGELDLNRLPDWLRSGVDSAGQDENEASADFASGDEIPEGAKVEEILGDWLNQDLADETSAQDTSGDDEVPDWLSDLQQRPDGGKEVTTDVSSDWWEAQGGGFEEGPAAAAEAETASWLNELDAGEDEIDDNDPLPDWLSELAADEPLGERTIEPDDPRDQPDSLGLTDWLAELESEAHTTDSELETGAVDADLIDVKIDQAESETLPDWLREEVREPEQTAESKAVEDLRGRLDDASDDEADNVPDWLREGFGDFADRPAKPPGDELRPGWMKAEPADGEDDILPDWLVELGDTPAPILTSESLPGGSLSEAGRTEDRDAVDELAAELEERSDEAVPILESDVPDWLRNEVVGSGKSERQFPDWLESDDEESDLTETEMPDWLRDEVRDTSGLDSQDLPDWLNAIAAQEPEVEIRAGDQQDELAELGQDEAFAGSEFEQADEVAEPLHDDLADLLREMAPKGTGILSPSDEDAEDLELAAELGELGIDATGSLGEIPDWLAELPEADELQGEAPAMGDETEIGQERAEWVAGIPVGISDEDELGLPDFEPEYSQTTGGTGELAENEVPEWLAAMAIQDEWPQLIDEELIAESITEEDATPPVIETATPTSERPAPEMSPEMSGVPKELAKQSLPEWLGDDFDEPEPAEEVIEEAAPLLASELPEWLLELDATGEQAELIPDGEQVAAEITPWAEPAAEWQETLDGRPLPDQESEAAEGLLAAEIPPWLLALRPGEYEAEAEEAAVDEPMETEGPLSGLRGVIQVGPLITTRHLASEPRHHMVTKEHRQQVALLSQITHAEQRPATKVTRTKVGPMAVSTRSLLGVLLLVIVVLSLLLPAWGIELPLLSRPPLPGAARDVFDQINSVAGETVLVSFEYSPAMAGELDPIAIMLLNQLAENGSPVVTMSQSAAGVALAERASEQVEDLESQSLGFVPGEAVGLRRLASCFSTSTACETMFGQTLSPEIQAGLADVKLAIVLTAERDGLINWIEQVQTQSEIPLVTGVTQALAPLVTPYLAAERLQGAVEGTSAAAAYERELLAGEGLVSEQQTALVIVQWAAILLLVGGSIFYGISALAARPTKGADA